MKRLLLITLALGLVLATGCARRSVERIDTTSTIDLSGRWNDSDSRLVAEEMIKDSLSRPWLTSFVDRNGKNPTMIVGEVQNRSHELIATETFIRDMEREYVNTGRVRVVQGGNFREALRKERGDQQEFASPETMKKWGQELGADFMLQGTINTIVDSYRNQKVVFYQVDLELTNIQTNEKVWIGSKEIRKMVTN